MVAGKTVNVTWDSRERYGRIVGWVTDPNGVEVRRHHYPNTRKSGAGNPWVGERDRESETNLEGGTMALPQTARRR